MTQAERERGAAAVEFALVLPVLLTLVLGIMEFGRIYMLQAQLSGAAREAVRTMALTNSATTARNVAMAATPNIPLTNANIVISPSSCPATQTNPPTTTTVTITYDTPLVTKLIGTSLTLKGTGVMLCDG